MNDKDARDLIIKCIRESEYKWRTARGISKDTGISISQVTKLLGRSPSVVRSKKANKYGQSLYTTRDKYQKNTSFSQRLYSAIVNKVG